MKPENFEALAWDVILRESSAEEERQLQTACAGDEFLAARFGQMEQEYQGLSASLQVLAVVRSETGPAMTVPEEQLARFMSTVAAAEASPASPEPPIIMPVVAAKGAASAAPPEKANTAWRWATGAAAALAIGFFKLLSHQAGHVAQLIEKGAAETVAHGAGQAAKTTARELSEAQARVLARQGLSPEISAKLAAREAATNAKLARGELKGAGAAALGAAGAMPLAAENSVQITVAGLGLRYERTGAGMQIIEVFPNSPAAAAGLVNGDIITEVFGFPVRSLSQSTLEKLLFDPLEATIELSYQRGEAKHTAKIIGATPKPESQKK